MNIFINEIGAGTASSNGGIWDEYSEQYQHKSIKKLQIYFQLALLFGANKVQI